jgi:hypothetical protein
MLHNVAIIKATLQKHPYSELNHLIDEWIFNDRHRGMLKDFLLHEHSYGKIAEDYGMSDRQIARIIPKLEAQLFEKI